MRSTCDPETLTQIGQIVVVHKLDVFNAILNATFAI